ncbi:AbrB/MazE/SpoVT family DNA-binding domain-containing protein [Fundicoccus culcitae]|uniref:AbrB/MazE/SpoVT family DNA-binding domain-containing protein n=1 Tax=Fundicoccus culcitae TaxID=2969821 RepID=A0ABY5P542_9LACT|nr:AbrB/MazE/SpoVT family DNA-binding domain-containing protein [Fundicoccus culcitae]UUX33831.1 AbrB/MazE/SpoVT family DNA-binding domain-containing protein [Fundicoccus culcitae]
MDYKQKLIISAKLSSKNQITIPREIRAKLGIQMHDEIAFEILESGHILLKKKIIDDFWSQVAEHQAQYGLFEDDAVDWGADMGDEVID